ncbi:S8 family peptidase [Kitasatospora sp. NPDC091207]|uniref:S8 family peptidase n=1 Tax=Kitasatospora sp. NPDC091207 TaxID=3364083 RepID=UPI0038069F59
MAVTTQKGATWGLARLDSRDKLSFKTFSQYTYDDAAAGAGVDVYVLSTGVNVHHSDFEGRAAWGKTIPQDVDEDGNGLGTHLAGIVAGLTYGVAKKAYIVAVKVAWNSGGADVKDVIAGLDWVTAHARGSDRPSIALLAPKETEKNVDLDAAVDRAVAQGVFVVVAAGDDNQDAVNCSPAGVPGAFTVGASTLADDRAHFSNWGPTIDVFAPGLNILSTGIGPTNTERETRSGTAQAAAHVAGLAACLISSSPDITTANVGSAITVLATTDLLKDIPAGTSNLLAYNNPDNA